MKSPACGGGMRCADRKRMGQIFKIEETARGAQLRQRQRPAARDCAHPFQKICAHGRPGSISPSALMLLTKIKRLAPARAAAAATRSVPATLVSWQAARNRGVFSDVSWTRAER